MKIKTAARNKNNKNQVIAINNVNEPNVKICIPNMLRNWKGVSGYANLNIADIPNTVAAHKSSYIK
jgi:hypothetical protein